MDPAQKKLIQHLTEAHATEQALTRELQTQIAMAPEGAYRSALETHLDQTRAHAQRVGARLKDLGHGANLVTAVVGLAEDVLGTAVAVGKAPWNLLRGTGGEEKVLKNAKDAAAAETLEIVTYTAIERLARAVGDVETARLAASIRADEEQMLQRVMREIPRLTAAVVGAEAGDEAGYELPATGRSNGNGDGARKPAATPARRPARRPRTPAAPQPAPRRASGDDDLRAAADAGDLGAAHQLGILLWRERGEPHAAVAWLDRAAQADVAAAQRDLGLVLREQGDHGGAHYWLNRAAERDDQARRVLAELG